VGRWADLDGLVEDIAMRGDLDRRALYELRLRSAGWYRDRMQDPGRAERTLAEALLLDPEPIEAHRQRVALIRAEGRSADLVAELRAWAEVEPSEDERVALLREAAELAQEALSSVEIAADCYHDLLAIDHDDVPALRALGEIRAGQSRWNEVVGLLERQLEIASGEARGQVARSLGEVHRDQLRDPRAAIRAYETALEIDENDAAAMDALESLYQNNDRLESLRALLERRVQSASDEQRTALQLRLAELYEHSFRDQGAAMDMFQQVLRADPGNVVAERELERLFEATGAWNDLIVMLLSKVGDASDEAQRAILERVAEIEDRKRGNADAAIAMYERINSDLGADERSLRALGALYERKESWTKAADVLERLLGRIDGPPAIDLAQRVADLWERQVGDPQQAGRALRVAHERFPNDASIRARLERYYESEGDHRALAELLDTELAMAATDSERQSLLQRISDIYRERLGDPAMAARYLERAVELGGDDRGALVPLCELYMAAGRDQDAVPILRRIIDSFGQKRSKDLATHQHRLGRALAAMGDAEGALAAYDAAFKIDLTNVAILRDLGKLTHASGDLDRAQKSFRALLLQKLEPDSGIQKADVYYYLGDIAAKQDDTRKALTMLERALAEDPSHEQASSLLAQLKG
jgi:tetratricopeptide (TPR) repeat protein